MPEKVTHNANPYARVGVSRPNSRRLRGYAFDPSLSVQLDTMGVNEVVFKVDWEDLAPGPVGEYLEVVDYDPASRSFYAPIDLDDPWLLAQDGLTPNEGSPQFHQQMVYAVAMTTIKNFERGLGRKALWARREDAEGESESPISRLRIYPHAMREANAYYSPAKKALLFGYFPATESRYSAQLPGATVFTCLSHDIIAHETTHALLDGMHRLFIEPSHPDVLAFHEAFADIVALFQHFSFPEVLRHQIAKTRGDLASQSLLGQLAQQFGRATGRYGALRNAIGEVDPKTGEWAPLEPDPEAYHTTLEPHARGAILVAAVFDAYISIYKRRVGDLFRLATGGTGVLPAGAIHPDLVNRLAAQAAKSARHVLTMCIRALDYCPPVDITFGDYLRALVTADSDVMPDDDRGYRVAFIEAFRRRGIFPSEVRSLSIESLRWPGDSADVDKNFSQLLRPLKEFVDRVRDVHTTKELLYENRRIRLVLQRLVSREFEDVAPFERLTGLVLSADRDVPGLQRRPSGQPLFEVYGSTPALRVGPGMKTLNQVVLSFVQTREVDFDQDPATGFQPYTFRGGCTLVLDLESGQLKYRVVKPVDDPMRLGRQLHFLRQMRGASLAAVYFGASPDSQAREPFALLHRGGPY